MPELVRWFRHLCARLRHVRIINGDWSRVVKTGAAHNIVVRQGKGPAGIFLDPPYADTSGRAKGLYNHDSMMVAHDVREWCLAHGDDPKFRIVLAGFEGEHGEVLEKAGWSVHEWFKKGHLRGGMGNVGGSGNHQMHRDRLWASPHCLTEQREATLLDISEEDECDSGSEIDSGA
jgi:DNA adenine methylase